MLKHKAFYISSNENKKQLLNFSEKRIKDFFYKFLGSTKSGYEWYVEKKLQNVKKHISDNNFNTFESYVPEIVSIKSEISNDSYLIYKKGI